MFSTAYVPVSPPNVLAPQAPDGALGFDDTTLSFGPDTQAAGLFLVLPQGSNSTTRWVSTVTVVDRSGQTETVLVEFQGEVGESRFIGFSSPDGLESIRFTIASRTDGTISVVAMDNLAIARSSKNPCSAATPTIATLHPPNHRWVEVGILGVTDSAGRPLAITITSIHQDEPVKGKGDGNTAPDGQGVGTATARLRAERAGGGNGRVYHIGFSATDTQGCGCSGVVKVTVPHDRSGRPVIDDGPLYDSMAR